MSSCRHKQERCRVCGSKDTKAVPPKENASAFKKLWYSRHHCRRCGVVFSIPLMGLGRIRMKKGIYLYSGEHTTSKEYTEIKLFNPENDGSELGLSKRKQQEEPQSYNLNLKLAGLEISIKIHKELAQAVGKAAGGFNKFLSGSSFEFTKNYGEQAKAENEKTKKSRKNRKNS